ncbi:hypothetical protein [Flavobacterium chilense]|uniref:Uncharacterized protein n=1 Tax=Flavobacterium chilense TaxID=946677 RepID=A0A1M7DQH7_9FLAO|nr:hypothetical protein [Flavobacterium chilense]SHL81736.1 hypothetical protein SAMN05444484_102679 [Flavobacterium chilense]
MQNKNVRNGIQINKLRRYKLIMDLYKKMVAEHPYTPITKIHKEYIYPVYPISRSTLYEILCTPINKLLSEYEEQNKKN